MAEQTIIPAQFHEHARQWEHRALTTEFLLALGAVVLSILGRVCKSRLMDNAPTWR